LVEFWSNLDRASPAVRRFGVFDAAAKMLYDHRAVNLLVGVVDSREALS
jgi:hypothetical protein